MNLPENHDAAQKPTVSINWLFFDKVERPIRCTEMPLALFDGLVQHSAEFFVNEIRRHYCFNADPGTIIFWRTKEPLSMDAVGTSWKGTVSELEARASIMPGPRCFSKYLQEAVTDADLVHLVITAEEQTRSNEDAGYVQDYQGEKIDAALEEVAKSPPLRTQKFETEEEGTTLASDPEAVKVREWRHKLQKAFLGRSIPKEKDIPALNALFSAVENYESMSVAYLQFSKIGKVMKHIARLDDCRVPKDAEYKFRERAKALVDKWHGILRAIQ